jgi:hypothetical protein
MTNLRKKIDELTLDYYCAVDDDEKTNSAFQDKKHWHIESNIHSDKTRNHWEFGVVPLFGEVEAERFGCRWGSWGHPWQAGCVLGEVWTSFCR